MTGEYSLGQCRLEQCPWLPPLVCSVDRLQVNMEPCCRDSVFFTFSPILPGATSDNVEGWVVQWWGCSPPINVVRVWFPEVMPHICLLLVLALAPGSFSPGTPVLHRKATFPNSNLIRNIRQKKHSVDVPHLNHYLLILIELMLGKVRCVVLPPPPLSLAPPVQSYTASNKPSCYCSRISSVGRALDCRAGGRRFDSWDWTNTQGLKITEKWMYCLCPANG